jgi:hypothetical protein
MAEPVAELDARFSSANARPTDWADASWQLEGAEVFWPTTVRPDGRPHVTPVLSVWLEGAMYFCTGRNERKGQREDQSRRTRWTGRLRLCSCP